MLSLMVNAFDTIEWGYFNPLRVTPCSVELLWVFGHAEHKRIKVCKLYLGNPHEVDLKLVERSSMPFLHSQFIGGKMYTNHSLFSFSFISDWSQIYEKRGKIRQKSKFVCFHSYQMTLNISLNINFHSDTYNITVNKCSFTKKKSSKEFQIKIATSTCVQACSEPMQILLGPK